MAKNLRSTAIEILCELERTRAPLSALLNQSEKNSGLQGKDRQLVRKIVCGVLRNRDYLDRLIDLLSRKSTGRMKPFIRQALRSALFQIFFLDRIPPSAAVNETIKALKSRRFPQQIQGFVNGLLRESIRRRQQLPRPTDPDDLGRPVLNHPVWLTERWEKRYGPAPMQRICQHNNREPGLCFRVDSVEARQNLTALLQDKNVQLKDGSYAPDALLVDGHRGALGEIDVVKTGAVQVQGQASQLASLLLGPFFRDCTVLDGCAGLGGKSSHLLSLMQAHGGSITAVEPDSRRFKLLRQTLEKKNGCCRVTAVNQSLQDFSRTTSQAFDRILIDAPCSGTGVIRKHPDIRWNRRQEELQRFGENQLKLLDSAVSLLAQDGILVYATCSIEAEENEQVVERFLAQHTDFEQTDCAVMLPAACEPIIRNGFLAPLPDQEIDGFFSARLTRRQE
jgi:16S rRNA (cytosine967-C5)-methyltransferase